MVAARSASPESRGYPLHLVSAEGQWVRSFGPPDSMAEPGGYVLERWSPTGELLLSVDVAPDWFEPRYLQRRERPLEEAPAPFVTYVAEGSDGRVWVLTMRADADWR